MGFNSGFKGLNFVEICPVGAELLHAVKRTDRPDEGNSRFSQFCEGVLKKKKNRHRKSDGA